MWKNNALGLHGGICIPRDSLLLLLLFISTVPSTVMISVLALLCVPDF